MSLDREHMGDLKMFKNIAVSCGLSIAEVEPWEDLAVAGVVTEVNFVVQVLSGPVFEPMECLCRLGQAQEGNDERAAEHDKKESSSTYHIISPRRLLRHLRSETRFFRHLLISLGFFSAFLLLFCLLHWVILAFAESYVAVTFDKVLLYVPS